MDLAGTPTDQLSSVLATGATDVQFAFICRAARAASLGRYDTVDHVMTYLFSDRAALPPFKALGDALGAAGRMPLRLPSVEFMVADLADKTAAPRAVAGADVIPWRPARGVYLMIERGHAPADHLIELPGVAGVWTYHGAKSPAPWENDATGGQITYCYLDDDPVAAAGPHTLLPFDWDRHVPGG